MFRTALISLDYSAAQGPLLDCLPDLRDMGVSRVILTHIVKTGYAQGAFYGNKDALEDWLRERATPMRAAGLEVEIEDRDADLIVVGKHGQNWAESTAIGSTAANLCEIARRPVLMVPLQTKKV